MANQKLQALVKRFAPGLREPLRRARTSTTARRLIALPGLVRFRAARRRAPNYIFDISASMGMGAMLSHAVCILKMAEVEGLRVRLAFTNPLYASRANTDYFEDFLVRRDPPTIDAAAIRIKVRSELDYRILSNSSLPTLREARELFVRHFAYSPAVEQALAVELRRLGPLDQVIGVHYRGTDKRLEAQVASWDAMRHAIRHSCERTGWNTLLLATDEPDFEAFVAQQFPDCTILRYAHEDVSREAGVPVHFTRGSGFAKGIEAMLLIVLLSRCGHLVRTASYLSAWSQILSPALPTFLVNPAGLYTARFPDRDLIDAIRYAVIDGV